MEQNIVEELKSKEVRLCVLSTSSKDGQPEAAVMGYAIKDDLTILLSTKKGTRKLKNISENNKVALVFGWDFGSLNIQYQGAARIIETGNEYKDTENFFFSQNPAAAKFKSPDTVFIEVKPTWIRTTDPRNHPPTVEEKKF